MNQVVALRLLSPVPGSVVHALNLRSLNTLRTLPLCADKLNLKHDNIFFIQCRLKTGGNIPKKFRRKLLPFEEELQMKQESFYKQADKDVILYTYYGRERKYRLISSLGIFLFLVILNSAELIYQLMRRAESLPEEKDENIPWYAWWRKINFRGKWKRYAATVGLILFGGLAFAFCMYQPTRYVRQITLLKGGKDIILNTYRPFGRNKSVTYSLKDISGQSESVKDGYFYVTVRGNRFPYIMDSEGEFPNRSLLDSTVGVQRF